MLSQYANLAKTNVITICFSSYIFQQPFILRLRVFDGLVFEKQTNVHITMNSMNLYPPIFETITFEETAIVEEDSATDYPIILAHVCYF